MKKCNIPCCSFPVSGILFGIAIGVLITYPFVTIHPIRWGLAILGLAVIIHLYPMVFKK